MRRSGLVLLATLVGALALTSCSSPTHRATSPTHSRRMPSLTLSVRVTSGYATVGESIYATTMLTNHTARTLHLTGSCPGQWAAVGLTRRGVPYDPAIEMGDTFCLSRTVIGPGESLSSPTTISTLWDGCGGAGVPACPPFDGAPLLPLGWYTVKVVNTGLPKGTVILPAPHIALVSAINGRLSGPSGPDHRHRHPRRRHRRRAIATSCDRTARAAAPTWSLRGSLQRPLPNEQSSPRGVPVVRDCRPQLPRFVGAAKLHGEQAPGCCMRTSAMNLANFVRLRTSGRRRPRRQEQLVRRRWTRRLGQARRSSWESRTRPCV
jgi:hypothetical protein